MEKLSIDERLETAGQLVVRANIFLDIWEFYHGPSRGKILDAMNNYPSFFLFDEHAHRFSFIVHAAALFEKADTINLSQLARELHEAGAISDVAMVEIQQLFASVKRVSTGVQYLLNPERGRTGPVGWRGWPDRRRCRALRRCR
jgi:hypothetical protein